MPNTPIEKVADPQKRFNLLGDVLQAPLMGYNVLDTIRAAQQPDERKITPAQIQMQVFGNLALA